VLETTHRRRRNEDADEDGVFTGNRRYRNQAKEQPGISPAIVSRLLDTTIFLGLKDLNLALPAYKEEVVTLEMLDDQGQQYQSMDSTLKQLAIQSSRYLSTWLQWSLARPNSAFRDEVVMVDEVEGDDGSVVRKVPLMELPAINPNGHKWLPKEDWLASFCKTEKQQGRKVLVYVRQTGTRDIQDRVQMPLQSAGLRVAILGGNIDPRKREDWILKRVNSIDALICNPRLVETGLDLVLFSTVVYFEIEYSLYTLWQSLRRVWRLGQSQPVKAVFSIYSSTMEAKALSLIGRKMKAAQLLFGDEVGGAIVPDDDGDFLTQLARDVLNGTKLADLQTLFADEMQVSNSPLGSPTETSPLMVPVLPASQTWEEWLWKHSAGGEKPASGRNGKHGLRAFPGQLSIWGEE
jgi:SNF2 family DNA or RNA helicase